MQTTNGLMGLVVKHASWWMTWFVHHLKLCFMTEFLVLSLHRRRQP